MKQRFGRQTAIWLRCLVVLCAVLLPATQALANGAPVDVYLSYLPNVSNWGSQTATGKAVVAVADGKVTLDVKGLTVLKTEHYQVWLESQTERKLYSVGDFSVAADGSGHVQWSLDALPYQEYRMLLITVEQGTQLATVASDRRSLAGLFPNKAIVQVTPGGPATGGGSGSGVAPIATPSHLPVTGAPVGPDLRPLLAVPLLLATLAAWLGRKHVSQ